MSAETVAYWAGQLAGPAGGVIVSMYALTKLFSCMDRLLALIEQLAIRRESDDHKAEVRS